MALYTKAWKWGILFAAFVFSLFFNQYTALADSSFEIPYTLGVNNEIICDSPPYNSSISFQSFKIGKDDIESNVFQSTTIGNGICIGHFAASTITYGNFDLGLGAGTYYLTLYLDNHFGEAYGYMVFECPESGFCEARKTTNVTTFSGTIDVDTVWTKNNNPYIVDQLTIPNNITLTMEAGVVVKFRNSISFIKINIGGQLKINGTDSDKVYLTSIKDDELVGDTNLDGNTTSPAKGSWDSLEIRNSGQVHAAHLILKYSQSGINNQGGSINIDNSSSSNNKTYSMLQNTGNAVITNSVFSDSDFGIYQTSGTMNIRNSSIKNNAYWGGLNETGTFDAVSNFWGDASGPFNEDLNPSGLGNKVTNNISFTPWLTEDPLGVPEVCSINCYSNVLFLPGIKGSVLKTNSETLWPPTPISNDVRQLELSYEGESINDIYTNGIINEFLVKPIYSPFSEFMDGITGDTELINEWIPLAYDWRFTPEKILEDGIKTETEVIDIVQRIESLASNSRTGKVTIVSHSMGGLLGKAIVKKLEEEGKANLIDSFVMIGTPQLGTPQTIGGLLHGDGEDVWGGFIVNSIDMRSIAQNMQSAYDLLPSQRYFEEIIDPIITFNESSSFTQPWIDFWGSFIGNYTDFTEFLTGQGIVRVKPPKNTLRLPEVLRPDLMTNSDNFHNEYDIYEFPENIRVVQVAGWGIPTIKAINYENVHFLQGYDVEPTIEGDKVVVYSSANASLGENYFFNLLDYRKQLDNDVSHKDLLSVLPVQDLLILVFKKENILENNFISTNKPQVTDIDDQLIVTTKSPVVLGAYDENNNFTGINTNQDLSAEVLLIKEDIPGSAFLYTSESQMIFLPKEGNYQIIYKGTGIGPTTLEIENFSADEATSIVNYTDIPTTSSTGASFALNSSMPENSVLEVDTDGNGEVDKLVSPDESNGLSLGQLISLLKEKVQLLNTTNKLKQNLFKRISIIEKKIENKKQRNKKILSNLERRILMKEVKGKISTADAKSITDLITLLELSSDKVSLDSSLISTLKVKIQSLSIGEKQKTSLLKNIEILEKKQQLTQALSNFTLSIVKKGEKGKITEVEIEELINLLTQIENVI